MNLLDTLYTRLKNLLPDCGPKSSGGRHRRPGRTDPPPLVACAHCGGVTMPFADNAGVTIWGSNPQPQTVTNLLVDGYRWCNKKTVPRLWARTHHFRLHRAAVYDLAAVLPAVYCWIILILNTGGGEGTGGRNAGGSSPLIFVYFCFGCQLFQNTILQVRENIWILQKKFENLHCLPMIAYNCVLLAPRFQTFLMGWPGKSEYYQIVSIVTILFGYIWKRLEMVIGL